LYFGNLTSFKGLAVTAMEAQQSFRLARIASQEGFHALLTMTIEPFQIARKAEHKKAQWIPACAGMTVHTGNDNLRGQGKEILFKQSLRLSSLSTAHIQPNATELSNSRSPVILFLHAPKQACATLLPIAPAFQALGFSKKFQAL
jgi:hypothetical protein